MSTSTRGVSRDTTATDLTPGITGDGAGAVWHRSMSPNSWAWTFVILALAALWGLGYLFR